MSGGDDDQFIHDGETAAQDAEHGIETPTSEHALPGLHEGDHLPWLDSVDDDFDQAGVDPKRVWAFVLAGLALLALIVGGVWLVTHHGGQGTQIADGSTIAAPDGAIKEAPATPGGKTFEGTGDSSFAVSQGHTPGATLATGVDHTADAATAAAAAAKVNAAAKSGATPAPEATGETSGGIGVQVGAFSTQAAAETAWSHLAKTYDALSGTSHRVVEGKADIGTVYRLQAVAGSDDAANSLCDKLKAAGLNCQVKD